MTLLCKMKEQLRNVQELKLVVLVSESEEVIFARLLGGLVSKSDLHLISYINGRIRLLSVPRMMSNFRMKSVLMFVGLI